MYSSFVQPLNSAKDFPSVSPLYTEHVYSFPNVTIATQQCKTVLGWGDPHIAQDKEPKPTHYTEKKNQYTIISDAQTGEDEFPGSASFTRSVVIIFVVCFQLII